MRMPRMQVYLPEPLYAEVKARKLPVSKLLQDAIRVEVRRQDLIAAGDEYLTELVAEVGEPGPDAMAWADDLVQRLERRAERSGG